MRISAGRDDSGPPDNTNAIEMRVHGIGGPRPAKVLGDPRRLLEADGVAIYERSPVAAEYVRAFDWGPLTRGRTLLSWFRPALLPFALVNVAGWSLHVTPIEAPIESLRRLLKAMPKADRRAQQALLLAMGIGTFVTASYVLWLVVLLVDLPRLACTSRSCDLAVTFGGWAVALAALLAPAIVRRRSGYRPDPTHSGSTVDLRSPNFWRDDAGAARASIQQILVVAAISIVFAGLAGAGIEFFGLLIWFFGFASLFIGYLVWLLRPSKDAEMESRRPEHRQAVLLLGSAMVLTYGFFGSLALIEIEVLIRTGVLVTSRPADALPLGFFAFSQELLVLLAFLGLAVVVFILVIGGRGMLLLRRTRAERARDFDLVVEAGSSGAGAEPSRRWSRRAVRLIALVHLVRKLPDVVHLPIVQVLIGAWILSVVFQASPSWHRFAIRIALGVFVASLLLVATRPLRRGIALAWDVLTFWPLRYHALAPRCYGSIAVPRLAGFIEDEDTPVVLSGHSQGTVICVAAAALLSRDALARTGLITYGSPLGSLYAPFFKSYFTDDLFSRLADELGGGWSNFRRATDPVGGTIGLDGVDVAPVGENWGPEFERPASHGQYRENPVVHAAVEDALAQLSP